MSEMLVIEKSTTYDEDGDIDSNERRLAVELSGDYVFIDLSGKKYDDDGLVADFFHYIALTKSDAHKLREFLNCNLEN
jgi:hypothetical protein